MTPAKTVREQVEALVAKYEPARKASREHAMATDRGDYKNLAIQERCLFDAGVLVFDNATLFAAAEETAAQLASLTKERDELIVNIRTLIMYSHIEPHVEKAYRAKEALRDFILSRQTEGK